MSSTHQSILEALRAVRLVDPHSHIDPHSPASTTLADILGYHYYTELAHSAGMPKSEIESAISDPRELVRRLATFLPHLSNTAQYGWLIDLCQRFFGFASDRIDASNWESLYDAAEQRMASADWCEHVLESSGVEAVFLTNDFDDALSGFDTRTYIPCLRTDELVFQFAKPEVRGRLEVSSGVSLDGSLDSLRDAIGQRFAHFVSRGARACAISLPPDFCPAPVSDGRAVTALDAVLREGVAADPSHTAALSRRIFWTIAELCDHHRLPFDLMIGVNRGVYAGGVHQGRDLYDSRVSLIQYRELFNAFPTVKFPVSVLASVTNQELVSYAWIFPNVITSGHWWYSNTPSFIKRDAAARLEAVPRNKQIGYYSDAYKLEFIAPKFEMYRGLLAEILYEDFVVRRGWTEENAIALGTQVLRGNVDEIFPDLSQPSFPVDSQTDEDIESGFVIPESVTGNTAAVASAAAIFAPALLAESLTEFDEPISEPIAFDDDVAAEAQSVDEPNVDVVRDELIDPPVDSRLDSTDELVSADDSPLARTPDIPLAEGSTDTPTGAQTIHYFRGDEVPEVAGEDELSIDFSDDDDGPGNLYHGPATGELRMPEPADDWDDLELEPIEAEEILMELDESFGDDPGDTDTPKPYSDDVVDFESWDDKPNQD